MAYGIIKIDTVTFTDAGIDKSVSISGLVQNPTFSGNVTATGTVSGNTIQGQTISGVTVTGATSTFVTGSFVSLTGTTIQGTTASYTSGSFTSLTGVTTSGTTANFVSGVFSTQISGATVTGTTASFTSGVFANISGGTHTVTSGVFAAGSAASPSISFTSDPDTGLYSPGANQVALSTNGTGRLFISAGGNIGIQASPNTFWGSDYPSLQIGKAAVLFGRNGVNDQTSLANNIFVNASNQNVRLETGTAHMYRMDSGGHIWYTAASGTGSTAATLQEYMRLDASGRLGIGTSLPSAALDVVSASTGVAEFNGPANASVAFTGSGFAEGKVQCGGAFVFGSTNNYPVAFAVNNAERLRIDSSGRVGIGTTGPSYPLEIAANTGIIAFDVDGINGNKIRYGGAGANANVLRFLEYTGAERARIDSAGRLLVGTSSTQQVGSVTANLQVAGTTAATSSISAIRHSADANPPYLTLGKSRGSLNGVTAVVNNDLLGYIEFAGADGTDISSIAARISAEVDGTPGADDMPGRLVFSTTADGASSPTERMKIDSLGRVIIGTTTAGGVNGITFDDFTAAARIQLNKSYSGTATGVNFAHNGVQVGSITYSNSATAYNTSSDYRLKENVVAVTDGITRLQQLKPSRFNFIADPDTTVDGFIAHEVQTIVPEAITGEKDAVDDDGKPVYQGIDQSKLVPLLTAALQEAIGEIESLKARLTAAGI